MNDNLIIAPKEYARIREESERIQFSMPSDLQTGSLLRTLVAAKPKGNFLELGTGTGLSLSWIVEGMDKDSTVVSVDNNETFTEIARSVFKDDSRVTILCVDGNEFLKQQQGSKFDLIFADAWPGKYSLIDCALELLVTGGLYIIDDMLCQPNWPSGHEENVKSLVEYLENREDLRITKLNWSTGIIIVSRIK